MSSNMARPRGGDGAARADASRQLALLDHGATLDGELLPPTRDFRARVLPGALRVLVP